MTNRKGGNKKGDLLKLAKNINLFLMNSTITETTLNTWINAIQTYDPNTVLTCYHPKAILVPTLSNTICTSPEQLKHYFINFCAKKPECVINEVHQQWLEPSKTQALSGIYTFTFDKAEQAKARFTFIYSAENLILHHHSSLLPE